MLFYEPILFRYYFIPWLVVYMLSIIGLVIGAMVIIVYFAIIFPIPSLAALSVIPIVSALLLLYWSVIILFKDCPWIAKLTQAQNWTELTKHIISYIRSTAVFAS